MEKIKLRISNDKIESCETLNKIDITKKILELLETEDVVIIEVKVNQKENQHNC